MRIQPGPHLAADVGRVDADSDGLGVGHVQFRFELHEPAQLSLVLGSKQATVENHHHRVLALDLGQGLQLALPVGEANVGEGCARHQISAHAYSVAPVGSVGMGARRVSKGPQRRLEIRRWGSLAACGPGAVSPWSEPGHAGDCALVAAATVAEFACDSRRLAARRLTRNASGGLVETFGMDPTLADQVLLEATKARSPTAAGCHVAAHTVAADAANLSGPSGRGAARSSTR